MKKNDLVRVNAKIYRILKLSEQEVLVIDCMKLTMPQWIEAASIPDAETITDEELCSLTDCHIPDIDELLPADRATAHKRFTLISGILPVIGDKNERSKEIAKASEQNAISKQSTRSYLCLYLAYQNIAALAPKKVMHERPLTDMEKEMRWGLNKFFYTKNRNSLTEAYTMLINAKYTDESGKLLHEYPSIHQFRYFYRKTRKMQNYYISRDGLKDYQRNSRPLTGDGVQEYANHVGIGMLDSTVCDIYLVNDAGQLVGRPLFAAAVDAYSGLCMGYTLTWEGGVYSLKALTASIMCNKVEHCLKYGITIDKDEWDVSMLPGTMVTDKGSEYVSENFEQMTELGITLIDLPSFRPELKGVVEKFFDLIQESFKPYLKGKGVIEPDFQERGSHDYRKDACLTLRDFEAVLIRCILFYNNNRIVENYPFTEDMLASGIKPYSRDIWNYGKSQPFADLIDVSYSDVMMTLLPRTTGSYTRYGLKVNKLRYHCEGYTEKYLTGGDVIVAYNPDDVSAVWTLDKGIYIKFSLIESRFEGRTLAEVEEMKALQRQIVRNETQENLQAKIDLAQHIQTITERKSSNGMTEIKGATNVRRKERRKSHRDFMKGV